MSRLELCRLRRASGASVSNKIDQIPQKRARDVSLVNLSEVPWWVQRWVRYLHVFVGWAGLPGGRSCLTLVAMRSTKLITARVPPETKAKFQTLAETYGLNESRFMRGLIDRAVDVVREPAGESVRMVQEENRAERLYVRLYPDDRLLLAERATARGMPAATYLAVLARAHLRNLAPLPETERKAFERGVAELSAIGRNLNQIARHLNQGGALASPRREDLALFIKICTTALGHLKATLKANKTSWEVGYESMDR